MLVAPDGMTTFAGTDIVLLVLASETTSPAGGAGFGTVTVHVVEPLKAMMAGEQANELMPVELTSESWAVWELPRYVADRIADWSVVKNPTVTEKVVLAAPAGTVIDVGRVNSLLLLERETKALPAGARLDKVTVHAATEFGPSAVGVHTSWLRLA
jgi:hypothetical protein